MSERRAPWSGPPAAAPPCGPKQSHRESLRPSRSRQHAGTLSAPSPLPLTDLHRLPRDTSMLYDIGRVDGSGRIASNDIVNALNWSPGSKLDVILTPQSIVLRSAPDGLFSVPQRPCIVIPSHARRPHGIKPGDHVLIAAAPTTVS